MSKKEKLIKELVDLIGEDKFTEKDKEELKSLSVEDLELMINLERVLAETSPSMEELLDKLTSSDDKEEDIEDSENIIEEEVVNNLDDLVKKMAEDLRTIFSEENNYEE